MTGGALVWGVKTSLMRYVRALADGSIQVTDGAESAESGAFRFPFVEASEDRRLLQYRGGLHWYGHSGLMDVTLSSPWVTLGATPSISMVVALPDMPTERLTIAHMEVAAIADDAWAGSRVRLTADGALTLGALQYSEYQQVDDLDFSAPASGRGNAE
ncbi:MAG: hypothetical protein D3X82_00380 [Candidatus Leucobacter sulfamidivorax]|nr:hypothetical protein [Candidatus Leucobacter sulfamidivorax]